MNKTAIKNFATWARNKLIADIAYKAGLLGITENGIREPLPQSTPDMQFFDIGTATPYAITGKEINQRRQLVNTIQKSENKHADYVTAFNAVVEEVAYTWFNRLIAIRFMEVNDYLPSRIRVLSSEKENKAEPDLVTSPFEANLPFTDAERTRIVQLKQENQLDELFQMLVLKQCNELNKILPELFEQINDYTELLLNISYTDANGVVAHLVSDIDEVDFRDQVQIIGWLYQYYNDERKNEVINIYKGTVKKEDIPAATQLFTTDWVVRYMVDNSLGRYWIERNSQSTLQEKLEFFVPPKNGKIQYVDEKIEPIDLTFLDPCMGSGHILVYAFDVLMEIYLERGYTARDAAESIIQNNLFGLDIDDRAYQLAYFAIMMKGRSYNRSLLTMDIYPNVLAMQESNGIESFTLDGFTTNKEQNAVGEYLVECFRHAKEIGSLQTVEQKDYESFLQYLEDLQANEKLDMFSSAWQQNTLPLMKSLVKQAEVLANQYTIVATNPPYMNKFEGHLKTFITKKYADYKGDLFSVFIYRNFSLCETNGYMGYMTPFVWMFIKTYEKLREYIIENKFITTLVQMEYSAFEEATVPICSFVLKNSKSEQEGMYFKLSDFRGGMDVQKQKVLEALADAACDYLYYTKADNFAKIPGMPIAYWLSEKMLKSFSVGVSLGEVADCCTGMQTGNNDRYVRMWYEPNYINTSIYSPDEKWHRYNCGGESRRWYGNHLNVIFWEDNGKRVKSESGSVIRNEKYYNCEGISWKRIGSSAFMLRYLPTGFVFDQAGDSMFVNSNVPLKYLLSFTNTVVALGAFEAIAPTLNLTAGNMNKLPIIFDSAQNDKVNIAASKCIGIAQTDWDSFETSWDFKRHPLIPKFRVFDTATNETEMYISAQYESWKQFTENQFLQLKANEEELNRIFIDIYGLQEELTPDVADKDVTVARIYDKKEDIPESMKGNNYVLTKTDVVKSFISYAVGCMFGRYSLDVEGLAYAGGEWDDSKYSTFLPDKDNILPITDEEYYEDDIVGLFVAFVKKVYGNETLEENLDFIAEALGNKGNSSREVIRNYFLNDFFKDHCKTYQKRPIYWLFDSGKANGFKALVYMHRYDENTIGNLRIDYLHRIQQVYNNELDRMQETIDNSTNGREVTAAEKRKEKLTKQLKEARDYDTKIGHLVNMRTTIDLDDGVKVNYEKVQTDEEGNKITVLAKIG